MVPVLFSGEVLGVPVEVRAYGTFLVLAAVVSLAVGVAGARRAGFPPGRIAAIYLGAIVAGLAGARFLDVALQQDAYAAAPQAAAALAPRGFALYGGLGAAIVIVATAIAVGARRGMPAPGVTAAAAFGRLADSAVPAVVAGIVLLRIGCFLNGCCTGVATDLPVGMAFPAGPSAATSFLGIETAEAPVHPTQLYEMAAAVLCGLNRLWGTGLSLESLMELGARLGSDVPALMSGGAVLMEGRGERVRPLACRWTAGMAWWLVVVNPGFGVPTGDVYSRYRTGLTSFAEIFKNASFALEKGDIDLASACLRNSLEEPVFRKYPLLGLLAERLKAAGALGVLLSGSGASLFALARTEEQARAVEECVRCGTGPWLWTRVAQVLPDGVIGSTRPFGG